MDETSPLLRSASNPSAAKHPDLEVHPAPSSPLPPPTLESTPLPDGDDPQNWTPAYKWLIVLLLAFTAFTVTFTCIGVVPIATNIVRDLDGRNNQSSHSTASVLLVTIWELGEAAGPLLIAPLSEVYGRYPVFNAANVLFLCCVALSALSQSTGLLIAGRFLTGCAVASNVLSPAIIGDMFPTEQRGSPMSLIMLAPLLGGAIGPAISGALAQSVGWRSVMWMSLLLAGVAEGVFLCFFRETYKPAILRRRAAAGTALDTDAEDPQKYGDDEREPSKSPVLISITRPAKVLRSSIVLQMLSLYGAVVFAFFYVMSTTLPEILQSRYHLPPALIGSSFLTFSKPETPSSPNPTMLEANA